MNALLLLGAAFQVAAAQPSAILVRGQQASRTVAVAQDPDGARVRADQLVAPLGGTVRVGADGQFTVLLGARTIAFLDDVPFARVGDSTYPLAVAPRVRNGVPWVPVHFVTEVLQRVATGVLYDPVYVELRQFAGSAPEPRMRATAARGAAEGSRAPTRRAAPVTARRSAAAARRRGGHVIVVDAGHGGPDGGMRGTTLDGSPIREKDITLAVAAKLAGVLRDRGYDVVMTRTTDTLIALGDRGRIANQARGELFLSIHVNAANPHWRDPGSARGFETYFLSTARTEDARRVEQMENEVMRFETASQGANGNPLAFVLTDMQQNEHLRESSDLAEIVQRELGGMHPGPSRGVKQAGFRVLVTAYMPAVLIELGFGTNRAEASFMTSPSEQRRLAEAISRAADAYFERYERRVGGGGH